MLTQCLSGLRDSLCCGLPAVRTAGASIGLLRPGSLRCVAACGHAVAGAVAGAVAVAGAADQSARVPVSARSGQPVATAAGGQRKRGARRRRRLLFFPPPPTAFPK